MLKSPKRMGPILGLNVHIRSVNRIVGLKPILKIRSDFGEYICPSALRWLCDSCVLYPCRLVKCQRLMRLLHGSIQSTHRKSGGLNTGHLTRSYIYHRFLSSLLAA